MTSRTPSHFTIEEQCVICRTTTQAVIDSAIFAEGRIYFHLFSREICRRYGEMEAGLKKLRFTPATFSFFFILQRCVIGEWYI
jgi:hypothetical protein